MVRLKNKRGFIKERTISNIIVYSVFVSINVNPITIILVCDTKREADDLIKIVVFGTRGFPGVPGGVEKHCEELYTRLAGLGCDVTVFTRKPYFPKEKQATEWNGVKFVHLWCPKQKSLEAIIHSFLSVLKARSIYPDILHVHAVGPALSIPFAKRLGLKVVMTHHGPDYERAKWGRIARFVLRKGEEFGVARSDQVIAISSVIENHVRKKFSRNVYYIPNGITLSTIVSPGAELEKWHLQPKRYIFTACRFVPEKGLHDLIAAYKRMEEKSIKLVIAGDADHETAYSKNLKKFASQTKGVVLTGFITGQGLAELFSNTRLFVLPSYYEGLPIALMEALGYGVPVLVSDIPQHRELSLEPSMYFPAGNTDALSQSLRDFLELESNRVENDSLLGRIRKEYNWDYIARKTLEVYHEVLQIRPLAIPTESRIAR